nr:BRO family protein [Amorphus coralli]
MKRGSTLWTPLGGRQILSTLNESGLYSLVLICRKPAPHRFRKWITPEIIPSIRKTGGYHRLRQLVPSLYGDKSKLINKGVSAGYRSFCLGSFRRVIQT